MGIRKIANAVMFQEVFDVSRETISALILYEQLLKKWNQHINLVSPSTINDIWHRHFADSAQLFQILPSNNVNWLDLGSGAGFPGLVLAIMAKHADQDIMLTLVESDQRKCAFLLNVAHSLDLSVTVLSERIEKLPPQKFDVISARALAPLDSLLALALPFCKKTTVCLFSKGNKHESELTDAQKFWHIEEQQIQSITDAESVILRIESFSRA